MTCRDFTAFIADVLDGGLSPAERQQFDRHLVRCANCARYLESYRAAVALGKAAFADLNAPIPSEVPGGLVEAILAARRERPSS